MITNIGMTNVKGQTATQPLTGKDIIIGRNGAGKTTRMQSIGLAMLGYVPGKGKTAADTFKLASDNTMTVEMETDNFTFARTFTKTSKLNKKGEQEVKIGQTLTVSPSMGERTNTQKELRIQQEMGELPVMLDFGSFINLTDNQQRDFIYNLSGDGFTWDKAKVKEELEALLRAEELRYTNPELYECMEKSIEETMKQYPDKIDVQAGILAMSEYAKERLKYWKKEKINADGAAKKLTELKNRATETDRDLAINQQKLKEMQANREQLIKEIAELSAKNKVLDDKKTELDKLQYEIEELETEPDSELMVTLENYIKEVQAEVEELEALEPERERKLTELQNELARLETEKNTAYDNLNALKADHAIINAEIKANGDLLQRIQDSHGCCAFSQKIPCKQDFSEFISQTQDIMDDAYDKKDEIELAIKTTAEKIAEVQCKINKAKDDQMILVLEKVNQERAKNRKKGCIEQDKTKLLELQGRTPMLEAKRTQASEITAYLLENPKVDLTAMEDQKTLLTEQIDKLTATIDEQKKVRHDLMNIKANIIDSKTADFNKLCWEQITNALGQEGIKGELMKELLNPLLEDVNVKLHAIGIGEEFYFKTNSDTGKEIFEFGWGEKPFEALSTGEQLLLMTALMTTIIERANPPVKVLAIDNINDLDAHNLSRVIKGLNTIGQNMDNIILAGVVEPTEEDSEGWTVWRL